MTELWECLLLQISVLFLSKRKYICLCICMYKSWHTVRWQEWQGTDSSTNTDFILFLSPPVPEWHLGVFQKSHLVFSSPSDWHCKNYFNKVGKYYTSNKWKCFELKLLMKLAFGGTQHGNCTVQKYFWRVVLILQVKDAKVSWRKKTCWRRLAVVAGSFGSFISFFLSGNWSATSAIYLHRGRTLENVPGLYWIYLNKIFSSRTIMLSAQIKTWENLD